MAHWFKYGLTWSFFIEGNFAASGFATGLWGLFLMTVKKDEEALIIWIFHVSLFHLVPYSSSL